MAQVQNEGAKGAIFYGLHAYPGVAEYQDLFARGDGSERPGRIFLNEATLRQMDPTFAGCPVFVMHADDVEQDIDKLRGEADGWVVESFFNQADGKHWVKFIVTSERGEEAIRQGFKLSNSYGADKLGKGGVWNDVSYDAEVLEGNFEHLALVPVPRYNESIILTPEKYKEYCSEKELEIQRIANGSDKPMGLKLFKRTKVENSAAVDLEGTIVELPKSKKEYTLLQIVNKADDHEMQAGMAHPDHLVDLGEGKKMTVKDLSNAYKAMCESAVENDDDMEDTEEAHESEEEAKEADEKPGKKAKNEGEDDAADRSAPVSGGNKSEKANEEGLAEEKVHPEEELPAAEKPHNGKKKNASGKPAPAAKTPEQLAEDAQRKADKLKADALRNASEATAPRAVVNFSMDQVQRGRQRYGSGR